MLVTTPKNCDISVKKAIQQLAAKLDNSAEPTFATITFTSLTATRLMATDADKKAASVTDLTAWIAGTANRVTVADDADGTVTLSGPQDIHTGASPTFDDLTISTPSNIYSLSHDSFADFVAAEHLSLPNTIANVLSDHNLAAHTALGLFDQHSDVDHNQTTNFVADEHIAHSSVTLTAGTGLTGGGDISASRTFAVDGLLEDLDALGASTADGEFLVATGAGTLAWESGATARTSIGLDTWAGTTNITTLGTIATGVWEGTDIGIAHGGTGQSTQQAALNALTNVSAATNEHVLTKDTATGNAIFKASAGGGGGFSSRVAAYPSSDQTIPKNSWTQVTLDVESYDGNNEFASNIFTPTTAGYYHCSARVCFLSMAAGKGCYAALNKNGGSNFAVQARYDSSAGTNRIPVDGDVYLNGTTDYVELRCYHSDTVNRDISGNIGNTNLHIHRFA